MATQGWTPTEAKVDAQVLLAIDNAARRETDNVIDLINSLETAGEGTYMDRQIAAARETARGLSGLLTPEAIRRHLDPVMLAYGEVIGKPNASPTDLATRLVPRYFIDNSKTVQSREISFGSISMDGSNTGTGAIYRMPVDADNLTLEDAWAEAYRAEIELDASHGVQRNREVFLIEGAQAWPNSLQRSGSGTEFRLACVDHRSSIVRNAGFENRSGTDAAPTGITSWTSDVAVIGDGTDYQFSTTVYQSGRNASERRRSLQILLDRTLTQRLDLSGRGLTKGVPMYGQLAWKADGGTAGVGTLTFSIGALTVSVVISGQTGWNVLQLPLTTTAWPRNIYDSDPLTVTVDWVRTSGDILIDDVILVPFTKVPRSNEWLVAVGGATPFVERDFGTWTNTEQDSPYAVIQDFIWRGYGVYWNHSTTPSITDPQLAA